MPQAESAPKHPQTPGTASSDARRQAAELTALEASIVNTLQGDFPMTHRPFDVSGQRLDLSGEQLRSTIASLLERKVLTRFGPLFQIERMGETGFMQRQGAAIDGEQDLHGLFLPQRDCVPDQGTPQVHCASVRGARSALQRKSRVGMRTGKRGQIGKSLGNLRTRACGMAAAHTPPRNRCIKSVHPGLRGPACFL